MELEQKLNDLASKLEGKSKQEVKDAIESFGSEIKGQIGADKEAFETQIQTLRLRLLLLV